MMAVPDNNRLDLILHRQLFEQYPFNLAVIDKDLCIVRANERFKEYFGDWQNKRCHEVYKRKEVACSECKTKKTFEDGKSRISEESGFDRDGNACHYVIHLSPLKDEEGKVEYVLEISRDITEAKQWQREYDILFDRVPCYVTVIDRNLKIIRANEKFRSTFGEGRGSLCYKAYKSRDMPCANCPALQTFEDGEAHVSEQVGITKDGEKTYYMVNTSPLTRGNGNVDHVIEIATDISHIKQLEKQNLEAERLAAVGQTVAGLAHTIKNMLMGLEGGMYMVDTGIRKNKPERLTRGWDVLQRNFNKTTELVRGFLSLAKGSQPKLQRIDPNIIVENIINLYGDSASQQSVLLKFEKNDSLEPIPLDPDGIEACITNLVSNGIDAVLLREEAGGEVKISIKEENKELIFEVRDNGSGMDNEIKQKIFTTFFTTKGGKGTGLGLLTTRKTVQEHGGKIEMETAEGEGSSFRIRLQRILLENAFKNMT